MLGAAGLIYKNAVFDTNRKPSPAQVLKKARNKWLSRFRCVLQQSFGSPFLFDCYWPVLWLVELTH